MTTATAVRPPQGRPGRKVLPAVPVKSRNVVERNRQIKAILNDRRRTKHPVTQAEVAERFGIDQSTVSSVWRNPASHKVAGRLRPKAAQPIRARPRSTRFGDEDDPSK